MSPLIAAEYPDDSGKFAQMIEGISDPGLLRVAKEIKVETVLPGSSSDRSRLDPGQVDITQCKYGHGTMEGSGAVLERENDRRLVSIIDWLFLRLTW